jgi:hypothetical protein
MTKELAIQRIQAAIAELRDYFAGQNRFDGNTDDEALVMLEEVEALQHRRPEDTGFAA